MANFQHTVTAIAAALLLAACAGLPYAPVRYTNDIMTNDAGMTLYTFDKDTPGSGKSACNGQCARNWPPFAAASTDQDGGDWTVITREDGSKQWAWLGMPLYLWSKDQRPGDMTGDGFNNAWRAVRPPPRPMDAGNMNGP